VPSSIPGTWLPATASAVSASRPKTFDSQADAKPSSAAPQPIAQARQRLGAARLVLDRSDAHL